MNIAEHSQKFKITKSEIYAMTIAQAQTTYTKHQDDPARDLWTHKEVTHETLCSDSQDNNSLARQ